MRKPRWSLILPVMFLALVGLFVFAQHRGEQNMNVYADYSLRQQREGKPGLNLPPWALLDAGLKSGKPTLVQFGRETCQICKEMEPVVAWAQEKHRSGVNFVKIDLDDDAAKLAEKYSIIGTPTYIFFDAKGRQAKRQVGAMKGSEMDNILSGLTAKG